MSSAIPDLLKWDKETDEPYLILPSFPDLRLTPWRAGDEDQAMKLFNDPTVGKYAKRRPYPYTAKDLGFFYNVIAPASLKTINTLLRPLLCSSATAPPAPNPNDHVPFYPLIIIRHHPSGTLIGDVQLFQPMSNASADAQSAAFGGAVPQALPPNEQVWEIAYNILPEWRGKGVGGAVLDVVVDGWVRRFGPGGLMAAIETVNPASAGLVRSRGFTKGRTYMQAWPEEKGGGEREMSEWVVKVGEYESRLGQGL